MHSEKAMKLAEKIEKSLPKAIVAVSAVDIGYLYYYRKLTIFAQHFDIVNNKERATGFLTIDAIKSGGAKGSLLNHSEHQLGMGEINNSVGELKKNGMKSVVCASTLEMVGQLMKLKNKPYAIAFEDSNLIATGKSITKYDREDLESFVKMLNKTGIMPICGAGISSLEDVVVARQLGCKGVLIASAIAAAKRPEQFLNSLEGIKF